MTVKNGRSPIMTATDVAACGLALRITFTGLEELVELGQKGTAYTFFTHANGRFDRNLIEILREAGQSVSPALANLTRSSGGGGSTGNFWTSGRGYGNQSLISESNTIPLGGLWRTC